MAAGQLNIGRSNWTLPFSIWKQGQSHPYPNSLHATIKRPQGSVSGISFTQVSSMFDEWLDHGLKGIEPKVVTLDQKYGKYRFSAEMNLELLKYPGREMYNKEGANPFKTDLRMLCVNWFLHIYSALDTGLIKPEKTEIRTFSDIPYITTATIWRDKPKGSSVLFSGDLICAFDWADTFLLYALYEVSREEGRLDDYKKVAGQLRMASQARISSLDSVYDASHILGLNEYLEYENILISMKDIRMFMPDLIKWSEEGKISLTEALGQFRNKYRRERIEVFAKIRSACEPV